LYWQNSLATVRQQEAATSVVLPIWLAQLLAVVAFGFFSLQVEIPAFAWLFAALVSAALLIQLAKEQLAQRQLAQAIQWVIIVAAIAVWATSAKFDFQSSIDVLGINCLFDLCNFCRLDYEN
jgi:hypothetical protein